MNSEPTASAIKLTMVQNPSGLHVDREAQGSDDEQREGPPVHR